MNYYSNLGRDHWGLMIDDFEYAGRDMAPMQGGAKIAIIDSANVTIQLPEQVYDNLLAEVLTVSDEAFEKYGGEKVRFYSVTNFDGSVTMEADQPCDVARLKLRNIAFLLEKTKVIIWPEGYTYDISMREKRCSIGV